MDKSRFRWFYSASMAAAAASFGLTHGILIFLDGLTRYETIHVDLTSLLVLAPYETFASLVFFLVGWVVAYIPVRFAAEFLQKRRSGKSLYLVFGMTFGVLFLPLCAAFPLVLFSDRYGPRYLDRCVEFALPMLIAGLVGGFVAWRCVRRSENSSQPELPGQHL